MAELSENGVVLDHEDGEQSFDVVPAGEYIVVIEDSDYVPNKQGTGKILKLTYQIIDGPFKERKIFENLNLENDSTQAQAIARKALNSIGKATGIVELKDSSQLHNIPFKIEVSVKNDEQYGQQNRIKKHLPLKEDTEKKSPAASKTESKKKSSGEKKHPWEKGK